MLLSTRSGNAGVSDIEATAKRALSKLRSRYKRLFRDMRLELDIEQETPKPFVDEMQLMLLFSELFTNAAEALNEFYNKHLEENGDAPFAFPPVIVRVREEGDMAKIEVVSCSAQACPFELDSLFEPLVTQYNDNKRIGLGLTVCLAIVDRFGGSIEVAEERIGNGCLFTTRFYLPTSGDNLDEPA
jgi:C4-dicarboxylate-specific signal transduction histidine kinase